MQASNATLRMCEPPVLRCMTNLQEDWGTAKRRHGAKTQSKFLDKCPSGRSRESEERYRVGKAVDVDSCVRRVTSYPSRSQLEDEVQKLQQLLQEEMELHVVLENALEHAAVSLSDLSSLPDNLQELLSSIATLEITVSRLEEGMISLHFQLIQERNERRLVEYQLKQLPSQSTSNIQHPQNTKHDKGDVILIQKEKANKDLFQHAASERLGKDIPPEGLGKHPNQLSEEIIHCMKNIFISLADASSVAPKAYSSTDISLPLSPSGHPSYSCSSIPESSRVASWVHSPRVRQQCHDETLATGTTFDPYKFEGKLCWADIGNYSLATEVSWMSVGKKQLEYAAGALRRFRSLIEQLAEVNPVHLDGNEKLAFWINLYNALIMHAYLAYGVPRNDMKLFSLMQKAAYTVGRHSFSAACIEYVILKMKPPNYRPHTAFLLALHKLKISDEQRKLSLETAEPLAVFALSCGSYSSPAVKVYTPSKVREELQEAQRDFVRASVGVSRKGKLLIPKMLHCFARGMVDESNIPFWISQFLPQQQAAFVEQCLSQRRQSFLGSRSCGVVPFDSRFRYLFLPEKLP